MILARLKGKTGVLVRATPGISRRICTSRRLFNEKNRKVFQNVSDEKSAEEDDPLGLKNLLTETNNHGGTASKGPITSSGIHTDSMNGSNDIEGNTFLSTYGAEQDTRAKNNDTEHEASLGKDKDDFDELLAALDLDTVIEDPKSDTKSEDSDKGISSRIDIDKDDENVFGMDFLSIDKEKDFKDVTRRERETFQKIFDTYRDKPLQEEQKAKLMKDLMESINIAQGESKKITSESSQSRRRLTEVSEKLRDTLFVKIGQALHPTVNYITSSPELDTGAKVVDYLKSTFVEWNKQVQKAKEQKESFEKIYLTRVLDNSTKFNDDHDEFIKLVHNQSLESPASPVLNVFTMPVIFNTVLTTLAWKMQAGQLASSLFNILKKDINLYTVCCNQQTYNEILKIQWIYFGKLNLYNIEISFIEMQNNGFMGDIVTFKILKQVIMEYHHLKMGNSHLNPYNFPVWSKEDNNRVENLERKLVSLGRSLKHSKSL
ncbi:Piso0_005597 [Millerozyma farinosa CBS 7064]|uniref:Piso0_005597 protein n=1 Tax=Pichia sorbitophila (strain ATCC MYA-4447 / BCRC 22081 / CBS 7064 / NBRC 10061 / NRRL Y-12695) TaxID=559304 RepID=G8XZF1_PICSO|nr:Piso0_005597 [Millerozyma farinosa CBS 7064]